MPDVKILTSDEIDYDIKDENGRLCTASEFSTSSNYVIGDYCWYGNKLYRFTANHSSSSWTAAHATEVKIANELKTVNDETAELKSATDELKNDMSVVFPTDTASGAIAHFEDGADGVAVKDLKISIEPVQEGSGDPSPDNVRPISGWTAANVARTGKNILSTTVENIKNLNNTGTWSGNVYSINGLTFTININTDGSIASINVNGTSTAETFLILFQDTPNPIKILHDVILNGCPSGGSISTYRLQANSITNGWYNTYGPERIIPSGEDIKFCRIDVLSSVTVNNAVFYPMIRFAPYSDPSYEPYIESTTYPITFGSAGTVYGGTLDVTTGVLTVDRGYINFNGSEAWTRSGSGTSCFYTGLQNTIKKVPNTAVANIECNRFKAVTDNETSNGTIGISVYNLGYIRICHTGATTTVADFKTWLASNNVQVVYELATPQTYQLTPTEVRTLLGNNNILADTGDTEVAYKADTILYIDNTIWYPYEGERISLAPTMSYKQIGYIQRGYSQGAACYGKYLFQFHSQNQNESANHNGCTVYDLDENKEIQFIDLGYNVNYHNNNASFGIEKYSDSDTFPLLYVSQESETTHGCLVYRVTETGNSSTPYALTLVQTITAPTELPTPQFIVDHDGYMWICTGTTNGGMKCAKFTLPLLSAGNVTLNYANKVDEITFTRIAQPQGAVINDGVLYYSQGDSVSTSLQAVDLTDGTVLSTIRFAQCGLPYEPEGIFMYKGKLGMSFSTGYTTVYSLSF